MAEIGSRDKVKVGFLGKVKTAMQMLSTICLLASCPENQISFLDVLSTKFYLFPIGIVSLYISTALASISGIQYFTSSTI